MARDQVIRLGDALPALLAVTLLGFGSPSRAQDTISVMPSITSDTPEYCGELMQRINGMTRTATTPLPTEVASLSEDGERMCVQGQVRGGIMRLRKAIAIMRHTDE